jgi:hypothetical protein
MPSPSAMTVGGVVCSRTSRGSGMARGPDPRSCLEGLPYPRIRTVGSGFLRAYNQSPEPSMCVLG